MARQPSEKKKREKTEKSLKNALKSNKMSEDFLQDKVDEYMSFYDDLIYVNDRLKKMKNDENCSIKSYTDATAEKRRISSEMRAMLRFLKLDPKDAFLAADNIEDEEL